MKVTFFCKIDDPKALRLIEFYRQDIEILERLGHEVYIATSYSEIKWNSDVLFIWWWTYAFLPVLLSKIFGIKTLVTGTFNFRAPQAPMDYFRRPMWQKILIKLAMKKANYNILVSKHEFEQIRNEWGFYNLVYSPHVIDIKKYTALPEKSEKDDYIFSIIWTGKRNMRRKCLPEIIESAKIVLKRYPDQKYLIAGRKGDGYEDALSLIEEAGLTNNVELLGEISEYDKLVYLRKCNLYLQPSRYEGFGVAIAEAMACGATVITSNSGEVKNVVGDAGVVLEGYDAASIAEATINLLSNREKSSKLSELARQRIVSNFSPDVRQADISQLIS